MSCGLALRVDPGTAAWKVETDKVMFPLKYHDQDCLPEVEPAWQVVRAFCLLVGFLEVGLEGVGLQEGPRQAWGKYMSDRN